MEDLLVQEKALSDAKQKIVELEKNIADLKTLIQNSDKAPVMASGWKAYAGPIAIAVMTLIALLILLKLSKSQAKQSATLPKVPAQAAQLFASLDLNLGGPTSAGAKNLNLPSAETLKVKLNLVRAYITIEDFSAAQKSLQEIVQIGGSIDPAIMIEAQGLLAELSHRNN